MKKRIISAVCAAAFIAGGAGAPVAGTALPLSAVTASADEGDIECEGYFLYYIQEDGTAYITNYVGNEKIVNVPATLGGKPVTVLGKFSIGFNYENGDSWKHMTDEDYTSEQVILPDTIRTIEFEAFAGLKCLKFVNLPDSLETIGDGAFEYCEALPEVTIPENVDYVGMSAFWACQSLDKITVRSKNASFGMKAMGYVLETPGGDYKEVKNNDLTIYCYKDSTAEQYAKDNDFKYELLDKPAPPAPAKADISKATVKAANKTYTGKALKPAPTVTLDGKTLKKGTDYTAAYKNNVNCGKATVTVTGKGDYEGSKSGSFIIKPAKMTAKKLTSPKAKTVKLTWKKAKGGVTGYKVQIALDKKFKKSAKTYTVKKASVTSKTIKKLKSKKTYFVRVCAYKKVGKTTYTGGWSKVKKVKCK